MVSFRVKVWVIYIAFSPMGSFVLGVEGEGFVYTSHNAQTTSDKSLSCLAWFILNSNVSTCRRPIRMRFVVLAIT